MRDGRDNAEVDQDYRLGSLKATDSVVPIHTHTANSTPVRITTGGTHDKSDFAIRRTTRS